MSVDCLLIKMTPEPPLTLGSMHKSEKSKQNKMIRTSSSHHLKSFVHFNLLRAIKIPLNLCVCVRAHVRVRVVNHCVCVSIHIKYFIKDVDDFPYLGSLHPSKADTDAQIHHRISSASGVMPDSKEEFLWTVTSRWRTACLQSSCSSHSGAKRHKPRSADQLQKTHWLPGTRDGVLPPGNHAC